MTWKSTFVYRIIIGLIFIGEYFVGFDGHGRGAGNVMLLLFGIAIGGYGLYGFVQREALRKKLAMKYGLLSSASWTDIEQADERKRSSVN
jgi:hypothetical protein